jgi:hypothetical protein
MQPLRLLALLRRITSATITLFYRMSDQLILSSHFPLVTIVNQAPTCASAIIRQSRHLTTLCFTGRPFKNAITTESLGLINRINYLVNTGDIVPMIIALRAK